MEDSPAAQASALKLTPHPILLSLSIGLLQVTVAISPPAAKGASKGNGFLGLSDRKVPAGKCTIRKLDERGASMAEQEALPNGSCHGLPGEG